MDAARRLLLETGQIMAVSAGCGVAAQMYGGLSGEENC